MRYNNGNEEMNNGRIATIFNHFFLNLIPRINKTIEMIIPIANQVYISIIVIIYTSKCYFSRTLLNNHGIPENIRIPESAVRIKN